EHVVSQAIGSIPDYGERRSNYFRAKRLAIDEELNTHNVDIVRRARRNRNESEHRRTLRRCSDRNGRGRRVRRPRGTLDRFLHIDLDLGLGQCTIVDPNLVYLTREVLTPHPVAANSQSTAGSDDGASERLAGY